MDVKIRYNNDTASSFRWRVIVDGIEHLVDSIELNCKSHTSEDELAGGIIKYHVSCTPKSVSFSNKKGIKRVILK